MEVLKRLPDHHFKIIRAGLPRIGASGKVFLCIGYQFGYIIFFNTHSAQSGRQTDIGIHRSNCISKVGSRRQSYGEAEALIFIAAFWRIERNTAGRNTALSVP